MNTGIKAQNKMKSLELVPLSSSIPCKADTAMIFDSKPAFSSEICVIPLDDDRHLIYAPLRRAALVGNARVVNFMAARQAGQPNTKGEDPDGALTTLLRGLEMLDAQPETQPVTHPAGTPQPTAVTLFLTTACNLRCTYCYARAGDTPVRSMALDVAKRGIDYVARNAVTTGAGHFEVNYHGGGEPTANWRTLTGSHEHAQSRAAELGLEMTASTATNGVLRDEQIDWIISHLQGASVSYDGLPEVQDAHRPTAGGEGSSLRVAHTLRRFAEAGFPHGIRVTVTADQIARLPDSVEYICSHFEAARIQVEPAYQMGRWRDAPSAETEAFIAAYREAQVRAAAYGKEIFFSGARVGLLTNHFCGITQDSFSLSPDGNVSACFETFSEDEEWAPVFFYGKPEEGGGYGYDLARLEHLRSQSVENREWCKGCFARWTCAGDCYHKALTVGGKDEFQGSDRCHVIRELTKDQILARIAQSGGHYWHEGGGTSGSAAGKEFLI